MTSAAVFAREYTSIWKLLAPTTDIFVRRLNADLYKRDFVPLRSEIEPARRALINEVAFSLFSRSVQERWSTWRPSADQIRQAILSVLQLISVYSEGVSHSEISEAESGELFDLIRRYRHFFLSKWRGEEIEFSPKFSGCGYIDTSAGDICCGSTLFEVKAGDRTFRSVDVRQLLVYAALNSISNARDLRSIGLFNPRTGMSFVGGIDEVCLEISGRPAADFLMELVRMVSSGDVSR
jgi:hypothetical protein